MEGESQEHRWQKCRDAVLIGVAMKEAAETYGFAYDTVVKRAEAEEWPTPARVRSNSVQVATPSPLELAANKRREAGENNRTAFLKLVTDALKTAKPAELAKWSDIETALKVSDKASGLEKATPQVAINFPSLQSSEVCPFVEVFDDLAPQIPAGEDEP